MNLIEEVRNEDSEAKLVEKHDLNLRISKTVRVADGIKRRMEKLSYVNWSEIIRQAIVQVLEQEEHRNLAMAVLLNERSVIIPDKGYRSVETIRRWRSKIR